MNILVRMVFGSHLYGTNTNESDLDYKGVFLPSKEEIFLGNIPRSVDTSTNKSHDKNSPDDVDVELYSLHYFVKLACAGETIAIDMLHAPTNMIDVHSTIWDEIVKHRELFYTKNLRAFVGYARRQAAKYGIKGSRLNDAKHIVSILQSCKEDRRLSEFWDKLPETDNLHHLKPNDNGIRQYQVCGRILQETMRAEYALSIVDKFYKAYGKRAEQAAQNEGIDWKAVSHAVRAAYQVKELLADNTITFPRPEAELLLKIKSGRLHFQKEVGPMLDNLIDEVEQLSKESTLPEKADRKFWDRFIIKTIETSL